MGHTQNRVKIYGQSFFLWVTYPGGDSSCCFDLDRKDFLVCLSFKSVTFDGLQITYITFCFFQKPWFQ